jgi:hypothetical protein
MEARIFQSFARELKEIVKTGALKDLDWASARHNVLGEVGPALGAILGTGVAGALRKSELGGAALGYGVGSIPSLMMEKKHT